MDADKNKMSIKFRDNFINDLENSHVWFNLEEFADIHNIDGAEIMAIFVKNHRSTTINLNGMFNSSEVYGIYDSDGILYVRTQEIEGVQAGQALRLDQRLYAVKDARKLQDQVWRIELTANES